MLVGVMCPKKLGGSITSATPDWSGATPITVPPASMLSADECANRASARSSAASFFARLPGCITSSWANGTNQSASVSARIRFRLP
jgi:hypothetical protein